MSSADRAAAAVRQANARACLLSLREAESPLTVGEIAARTGLSRPTVDAVLQDLIGFSVVQRSSPADACTPGRPARRFGFDPSATLVAGVDVGARTIRCTLSDTAGHIVARNQVAYQPSMRPDRLEVLAASVEAAIALARPNHGRNSGAAGRIVSRPAAIGVAIPGILDRRGRVTRSLAAPDLEGVDVGARLLSRLGCPVSVENDIKLAAYAEQHVGNGADNQVFLQIGHRISLAVIVEGRILQGSHRQAGELGSHRGMRWTKTSEYGELRWSTGVEAEELFSRAATGDQRAVTEIDAFCAEIAPRIAQLLLAIDPEVVVVGGGLSRAGTILIEPLQRHVHRLLMTAEKPDFRRAGLAHGATAIGALGRAFDDNSTEIFGIPAVPPPWRHWPSASETTSEKGT
jgi:predicted NBD/HSP70 family sugar kinase